MTGYMGRIRMLKEYCRQRGRDDEGTPGPGKMAKAGVERYGSVARVEGVRR